MEYAGLNEVLKNISASVVVYKVDQDNRIVMEYFNDRFAQIYGGDSEILREELKKDFTFGVADEYKQEITEMFARVVSTGEEGEATYRAATKGKERIWVNVKLSPVVSQKDTLVYVTFFDVTNQIEAMEKAKRSEQYLQQACEFANIFSWVYELDTKVIHVGKLLQEKVGLPESMENFPECIFELHMVDPQYVELYRSSIEELNSGKEVVEFEVQATLPDGVSHWISYRFDLLEYENGKPKIAVGTAQYSDVNKRLEARFALEQRRKIVDDPSMMGYVISNINKDQVVEKNNLQNKMQFSNGDMCYSSVADAFSKTIVSAEERELWTKTHTIDHMLQLFRDGTTAVELQVNVRCKDGIMRWVREVMNLVQHPETGEILLYNYFYDNHDQKVFSELMNAMADYGYEICGSLVADLDQLSLIYAGNQAHNMIVGNYTALNTNYANQVIEEDRQMYLETSSIEYILSEITDDKDGYETTFRTLENGEIHFKRAQCYIYNRKERTYLILRSDVSETVRAETEKREQLEAALDEAKKANLAKSNFLSRMSHELRTPLNAINGYTTLIDEKLGDGEIDVKEIGNNVDLTQKATAYLLNIISDILDIQSIEQGKTVIHKNAVDIESYIRNVADMIQNEADKKDITYTFTQNTHLNQYYLLDGPRYQQILLNILHNAIKFTPQGGTVNMICEAEVMDSQNTMLTIRVKDNGIGMSRDFLENGLFQKFAQENEDITSPYDGCGTGLFLCRELIHLMGGEITCDSKKGEGSEFVITLAAQPVNRPHREHRRREHAAIDLSGKRILLCEDNPMNQDMERDLLKRMKCEVDIADDGQIGLNQFESSPEHYYDMVLMDIRMPNMDGLEATRRMRELPRADAKKIPILAVSANAFAEDVQKSLDAGMNEHLSKPVDARILSQKILEYCK